MIDRIAVIGSSGQLGTDLVSALRTAGCFEIIPLAHDAVECIDPESLRKGLFPIKPRVVINCAAFVRVDECEDHPDEAFRVNAIGAFNVAKTCAELHALCVYVSTDYVFDGVKSAAYSESDIPCPINVYGASKLAGEILVRQAAPRYLIVRMASLFGKNGARGKGGNFVETVIAKAKAGQPLRVVNDVRMSPTYTYDAAQALVHIIRSDATTAGILHLTNEGSCTWYEFALAIVAETGLSAAIEPADSISYPTKAARPKNSSFASEKLDRIVSMPLRSWRSALRAYLLEKGHIANSPQDQKQRDSDNEIPPNRRQAIRGA